MRSILIGLSALALLGLTSGSIAQNNPHGALNNKLLLSSAAKASIQLVADDESTTNSDQSQDQEQNQDQSDDNGNGNQDTDSSKDQSKDQSTSPQNDEDSSQQPSEGDADQD